MVSKYYKIFLILIVVGFAFFLRFNNVTNDPPSLNWDETSIGYNAYSILKSGRDEWGVVMPLHFKSYGEYKLPAQIYASIPGIAIFGLNELGVRITPVLYGTLTVLLLFFLAKEISKNFWVGILSSFLLAISPWHIQLTRASFESSFSVFWVVLGTWLLIKGFKERKYWFWSIIPFVISVYTYNAARVFAPMFLITLFVIYRKDVLTNVRVFVICLIIFIISLIPIVPFYLSGEATARLQLVSISDDPGFVQRINVARGKTNLPAPIPKLLHNKVTHYVYVFAGNYLSHFSPDFLFINGAGHKQHHVQGIGEFYMIQGPFILLGLYFLFAKKNKWRWLIISWLLLAFIPVSVTVDSIPNALRTVLAAVPYEILTALGFLEVLRMVGKKRAAKFALIIASMALLGLQMKSYFNNYYNIYPKLYSRDWQYGYKQVVSYIKEHYDGYDLIVFSRTYGEPHMFTLFFLNWDPAKYQNNPNLDRFEANRWIWVLKFDKFYFPDLGDPGTHYQDILAANLGKKILFIGKKEDFPGNLNRLFTVDFLNGNRAFDVVESK
jgi:4-amino-4-deoxy-L-arabinose transferase-like glycosyltransferase